MKLLRALPLLLLAVFALMPEPATAQEMQAVQCPPYVTDPATECLKPTGTGWGSGATLVEVWYNLGDYTNPYFVFYGYYWINELMPNWFEWLLGWIGATTAVLSWFYKFWPHF